ncbi:MAG TPA: hypothetical protein VER03_21905 [Bryobacteraceae bacterium]|nr:hypothetical protein [Bryobacteraceae bacterium]
MARRIATALLLSMSALLAQQPGGVWRPEKAREILDKTRTLRLAPEGAGLSAGERVAIASLLEVGKIFQSVYENQLHPQAQEAQAQLASLKPPRPDLMNLYRLFKGPVATTLDNKREPFLPVQPEAPGKNVYPAGVKKEEIERFLAAHPEKRAAILDPRAVVRRATAESLRSDLATLTKYPALDTLHPGLRRELSAGPTPTAFYAVPYAVAYAEQMIRAHELLYQAASALQQDDAEFAGFLRNRARDLLTNDYESGDAAWVTGRFKNLNAEIGAYETYDDALFGVKAFYAFNILVQQREETERLRSAMKGIQAIEDALPYEHHKRIREDIPVGVYEVAADFGQSRGGNTATILPNEAYLTRRYGRTILLRANIMRNSQLFEGSSSAWTASVAPEHANDLALDGNFYRTLWHEVGHYLGVDTTKSGSDLDTALQSDASLLEEMKADLVSLFSADKLKQQGYYTDAQLRSVYASGILRVLQNVRPRRDQPYGTMQLMQWNYFLEQGLLKFDPASGRLRIDYSKYKDVVGKLLERVLDVQYQGDRGEAGKFIDRYATWDDKLHGVIAASIRNQQRYRFNLFHYAVLGE